MGAVVDLLTQEAERQMHAVAASVRRDLEIMARANFVNRQEICAHAL